MEQLLEYQHRILGPFDRVASGPLVAVNLPVIAALETLVAKEVHLVEREASRLSGFGLEVLKTVGLVPAGGEYIEGDLAADGETSFR